MTFILFRTILLAAEAALRPQDNLSSLKGLHDIDKNVYTRFIVRSKRLDRHQSS